jgi:hypothetical protein
LSHGIGRDECVLDVYHNYTFRVVTGMGKVQRMLLQANGHDHEQDEAVETFSMCYLHEASPGYIPDLARGEIQHFDKLAGI